MNAKLPAPGQQIHLLQPLPAMAAGAVATASLKARAMVSPAVKARAKVSLAIKARAKVNLAVKARAKASLAVKARAKARASPAFKAKAKAQILCRCQCHPCTCSLSTMTHICRGNPFTTPITKAAHMKAATVRMPGALPMITCGTSVCYCTARFRRLNFRS